MSTTEPTNSADRVSLPVRRKLWSLVRRFFRIVGSQYRRLVHIFPALSLCTAGFLTFYLLSAGPIAGIHNVMKVGAFRKAVEVIYAPVVLLVKSNIEPFSSIMKWYVDLFR